MPTDFSPGAKEAYEFGLDLAGQLNARIHLVHVVPNFTSPDFENFPLARKQEAVISKVKQELVAFAKKGSGAIVPVYPEVRVGSAWREITQAARDDRVDLIVIPTHGYTGLKRFLLGSVAEKVVRHAPCPVLVLRGKQVDSLTVPSGGRWNRKEQP